MAKTKSSKNGAKNGLSGKSGKLPSAKTLLENYQPQEILLTLRTGLERQRPRLP